MADNTVTGSTDVNAGHLGNSDPAVMNNPKNKAPADQATYDPKDAKWATLPGAAARANNYPRSG